MEYGICVTACFIRVSQTAGVSLALLVLDYETEKMHVASYHETKGSLELVLTILEEPQVTRVPMINF